MKIMGWEESVTFMAVVAVVSILLRFIPALAPEVCDAVWFFFAGNFEMFMINSSTAYIS